MLSSQWTRRVMALATVFALVCAACGGDESGGESGDLGSVRVAWGTGADAYVPQARGPVIYGPEFGLNQELSDIDQFDSHATAAQVLLAGQADVLVSSFISYVQMVQQEQEVVTFCPVQGKATEHIVGVGDITELDQITDPDVVVGVDSPGGYINYVMNHVFRSRGLGITVSDLQNVKILEDGSLRLAALASGEINVGSLDPFELAELRTELGAENVHVLSVTAADMDQSLGDAYATTREWLDNNLESAAAFCAAVLKANREMAKDFDLYVQTVNDAIEPDPDLEVLRVNWELVREYQIWSYNIDLLTPEVAETDIQVGIDSELLDPSAADLTFADVADSRAAEMALELLGGPIDPSEITG